jgi:hypothetical protein
MMKGLISSRCNFFEIEVENEGVIRPYLVFTSRPYLVFK